MAAKSQQGGERTWSGRVRLAASALLLLHLAAVATGPWSVEPAPLLSNYVWSFFRPYLQAAYLNHGYHFFAPEPGPSHLVRYELELADGSRLEGIFPDKSVHRPRLFYHRHFMLSEFLNAAPPDSDWQRAYARSYAEHLLKKHDARTATLYLRRHLIAPPDRVYEGLPIDDPSLYEERLLGTYGGEGA